MENRWQNTFVFFWSTWAKNKDFPAQVGEPRLSNSWSKKILFLCFLPTYNSFLNNFVNSWQKHIVCMTKSIRMIGNRILMKLLDKKLFFGKYKLFVLSVSVGGDIDSMSLMELFNNNTSCIIGQFYITVSIWLRRAL